MGEGGVALATSTADARLEEHGPVYWGANTVPWKDGSCWTLASLLQEYHFGRGAWGGHRQLVPIPQAHADPGPGHVLSPPQARTIAGVRGASGHGEDPEGSYTSLALGLCIALSGFPRCCSSSTKLLFPASAPRGMGKGGGHGRDVQR